MSYFYMKLLTLSETVFTGGWTMSDGPHRSLPMRKPWKDLAMRGDKAAYSASEVAEAATNALASDFKMEVSWELTQS